MYNESNSPTILHTPPAELRGKLVEMLNILNEARPAAVVLFKRMYSHENPEAQIDDVVQAMPDEKIAWAICQVENTKDYQEAMAKPQPINDGAVAGDNCGAEGCTGILQDDGSEEGCSCHISPPCSHCVEAFDRLYCPECGWQGSEE